MTKPWEKYATGTGAPDASLPTAPAPQKADGPWSKYTDSAPSGKALSIAPNISTLPGLGPILAPLTGMDGRVSVVDVGDDPQGRYEAALAKVREEQFPHMTDEQWADYSAKAFRPYDLTDLNAQGALLGASDEIASGVGAIGSGLRNFLTGEGQDFGEAFATYEELEEARRDLGRVKEGALGTVSEVVGGLASLGRPGLVRGAPVPGALGPSNQLLPTVVAPTGNFLTRTTKGLTGATGLGGAYGFASADGDVEERLGGAGVGAGLGFAARAALPAVATGVQSLAARRAARAALEDAVAAAPTAAAIKGHSRAAYKAAEGTGAVIDQPAMGILSRDVRQFATDEGLILPSGAVADGFPKLAGALRAVDEFSAAPVTMKQAQTVQRAIRRVAKSTDPEEARLGAMMLDEFEGFMEGLPPSAFAQGDGVQAMQLWKQGRADWARFRRTQTIEDLLSKASRADGGLATGLRSGFRRVLDSPKKQRGFSQADLDAMEEFVQGGPVQTLLERLGSGDPTLAAVVGHLLGGSLGASVAFGARVGGGALARRALDRSARDAGNALRASVATPGGLPANVLSRTAPSVNANAAALGTRLVPAAGPVASAPGGRTVTLRELMQRPFVGEVARAG